MRSKVVRALDHFFTTAKKGYDTYSWIFAVVAGTGIVTQLFGVVGTGAGIMAFISLYFLGRTAMLREKELAEEKSRAKKRQASTYK